MQAATRSNVARQVVMVVAVLTVAAVVTAVVVERQVRTVRCTVFARKVTTMHANALDSMAW